MKTKKIPIYTFSLVLTTLLLSCNEIKTPANTNEVAQISNAIKQKFGEFEITRIVKDQEFFETKYYVHSMNYLFVELNKNYKIVKISSPVGIPQNIVPKQITDFLTMYYPNTPITTWDKEGLKYEIELNNGVEIKFSKGGKFLKLDAS